MSFAPGRKLSICCFSHLCIPAPLPPTRELPIGQVKLAFSGQSSTSQQTLSDSTAQGAAEAAAQQGHIPQAMPPGVLRDPRTSPCPGPFFFLGRVRGEGQHFTSSLQRGAPALRGTTVCPRRGRRSAGGFASGGQTAGKREDGAAAQGGTDGPVSKLAPEPLKNKQQRSCNRGHFTELGVSSPLPLA